MKYLYRTMNGLAVLGLLTITPADAQKPSLACKLLQPAEIESALGGKAVQKSSDIANNGGIAMDICNVEITRQAGTGPLVVTIQILTNLPMDGGDMLRIRNRGVGSEPQWKGAGAQFEEKTVGNTICTRYGRPGVPAHSVCSIPRAKGYVEVDVQSPGQQDMASMDAVRTLAEKAVTRW